MSPARRRYGSAILSALLMTAAFPPWGQRWLAWVALVPWLTCLVRDRGEGHKGPGFVFGLVHFTTGLGWLFPLHPLFPPALSSILALYPLLFAFLFRRAARLGLEGSVLALPFLWVGVDFLREHLASGFPWLLPGHALAGHGNLRQAAALGGEHLLTFALVGVNTAVAGWRAGTRFRWRMLAAAVALPALLATQGAYARESMRDGSGPRVLLVQPAFTMALKGEALQSEMSAREMREVQLGLTLQGLFRHPETDLVVWAETMIPSRLRAKDPRRDIQSGETTRKLQALADPMGVVPGARRRFLGGALVEDPDAERNAVLLVGPMGRIEARFDKVHLTPFGEYLPGISLLPEGARRTIEGWIENISPFIPDLKPGSAAPVSFEMAEGRRLVLGGLVCYEVLFPALSRDRTLAGAEVLVNLSNYGWYGTGIQEQILDVTRLRAVETRRPVVVATSSGPTCILDGNGDVRTSIPGGRGFLHAEVPLDGRSSLYLSSGEVVAWLCAAAGLLAVIAGVRRGRKRAAENGFETS